MKTCLIISKFADTVEEKANSLEKLDERTLKNLVLSDFSEDVVNQHEGKVDTTDGVVVRTDAFEVNIDVTGFQAQDLTVIMKDDIVTITGLREEQSPDGTEQVKRSFERKYTIAGNIDRDKVTCSVTADGTILKFIAPFAAPTVPVEVYEKKVTMRTKTTRHG